MLIPIAPKFRKRRRGSKAPAPVRAFVLTSAAFDPEELTITLGFSRAIDVSAIFGPAINVNDPETTALTFEGSGPPTLIDPQTVRVGLVDIGPAEGAETTLLALESNGIKALDDGTPWAGATDLGLPFP